MNSRYWRRARAAAGAAAVAVAATTACRELVPRASLQAVPEGRDLHVALSDAGRAAVVPTLGPRVAEIDGRVVARGDSTLTLAVTEVLRVDGSGESFRGDRVVVPWSAVRQAAVPRTAAARSLVLGAGIALAAVLVARGIGASHGVQGAHGGGPTSTQ